MRLITLSIICLTLSILPSCKKQSNACTDKFTGMWTGMMQNSFCSFSTTVEVKTTSNDCEVLFPNLPGESCYNTSYQVLGTVSGDSVFIASQPFGLTTIQGSGAVYLNQFVLHLQLGTGTLTDITVTK